MADLPVAPQSSWYYVRKNRLGARDALQALYGPDVNVGPKLAILVKTIDERMGLTRLPNGSTASRVQISSELSSPPECSPANTSPESSSSLACNLLFQLASLCDSGAFSLGVGVSSYGVVGSLVSWAVVTT